MIQAGEKMSDFPQVYKIKQKFDKKTVINLDDEVKRAVDDSLAKADLRKGARISVTAGSRGIKNIVSILQTIVGELKNKGYCPFLVAAMGSHGRGEASGQKVVLESLGITESSIGAPVSCGDQVTQVGKTDKQTGQLPVYMAKEAAEADATLVVNRVKPHTAFHGPYESGLLKMIALGLGRPKGAMMVHSLGAERMAEVIPAIARVSLEKANVIGGIAIVENAYDETALIKGVPSDSIFEIEKELLIEAKTMMPSLPVDQMDLCLVGEMGKNYSGTGMDTNIIGRMRIEGIPEPEKPVIKYLGVLNLSKESHGNANGVGLADFTTESLVADIDREATYLNGLTSGFAIRCAIPITFKNDHKLLEGAMKALKVKDPATMRLVYVKNTLHLEEVWVSEPVYEEIKDKPNVTRINGPASLLFDESGRIRWS
jgi:hypothetical protein